MDEYFCPHCGAVLNDQDGFDPTEGTWRCTECGEFLMDDDVYEGDTYEGVAWFCDGCGALLNRQSGFTDSEDTWRCTECGYVNGTTEDDIIDEEEEDTQLRCPNCDAILEDQCCFSEYDDDWECTECGAHLHHCYSDDPYEIVDIDDDEDDEDCDDFADSADIEYTGAADEKCSTNESSLHTEEPVYASEKPVSKSWKRRHWKFLFVLSLVGIILLAALIGAYEIHTLIPVRKSSQEMVGRNYEDVITELEESGFRWVEEFPIQDLDVESIHQENKVTEVKIGWKDSFPSDAKMPSNFPVRVTYHTVKLIKVPMRSRDAKDQQYTQIQSAFKEAGFVNIKVVPDFDIITGWISKPGEVESISINGDKRFTEDEKFRPDAEIVITYHAPMKEKPSDS